MEQYIEIRFREVYHRQKIHINASECGCQKRTKYLKKKNFGGTLRTSRSKEKQTL